MNSLSRKELHKVQREYLVELGLSLDAIEVYELLVRFEALTAQGVAAHTRRFASAQYRLLYRLEEYGLVRREGGRPLKFVALPIDTGFSAALAVKERVLSRLLAQSLKGDSSDEETSQLRLIVGREALYAEYARMAPKASSTIDAYTIGIAFSDELVAVQRAAIKRGVRIRHVIQQLKPSNYHIAHTWQRIGVDIRLSRSDRGFHIMIFDNSTVVVTFSSPINTEDRISIVAKGGPIVRMFLAYFNQIWASARKIDV